MEGSTPATSPVLIVHTITGGRFHVLAADLAAAQAQHAVNVPLCDAATGQRIEDLHPGRLPGDPRGRLRLGSIASTEALPAPIQVQAEPVQAQAAAPIVATTAAGLMLPPQDEQAEGYSL